MQQLREVFIDVQLKTGFHPWLFFLSLFLYSPSLFANNLRLNEFPSTRELSSSSLRRNLSLPRNDFDRGFAIIRGARDSCTMNRMIIDDKIVIANKCGLIERFGCARIYENEITSLFYEGGETRRQRKESG